MQYLVERYDTDYKISFPKGSREYYEVNNWLFFQNAGVGPMQGQASKCIFSLSYLWWIEGSSVKSVYAAELDAGAATD